MAIKRIVSWIARAFSVTEMGLCLVSVGIIAFLMLFTTGEVIGRYILNSPIPGHYEVVQMLVGTMVFLGLAYTERMGGHLKMEIVVERLSKKYFHLLEFSTTTLSLLIFAVLSVYGFKYALWTYEQGHFVGEASGVPAWPFLIAIPLGGFYLSLRLAASSFANLVSLLKRK